MKVKYTIHRDSSKIGKVEDVPERLGERLIRAGHAVAADGVRATAAKAAPKKAGDSGDSGK